MNPDKLYAKAAQLYKEGNLEAAKAILEELDTPQARTALNKVNSAISAKKQAALAQHRQTGEKPKNAPKNPPPPNGGFILGLFAIILACGVCWISLAPYLPNQPRDSIVEVCKWIEGISDNTCNPSRLMSDYRPAIDACYAIWNDANIYNIGEWAACLENKSVDLTD